MVSSWQVFVQPLSHYYYLGLQIRSIFSPKSSAFYNSYRIQLQLLTKVHACLLAGQWAIS